MGIGRRIKEARENLGLTQNELAERVGITASAITNYEKETSHPKESIMYKLIEILNVDANYLFQDVVKINYQFEANFSEQEIIKKYRVLDEHGKSLIDLVLNSEYERCTTVPEIPQEATRIINYYYRLASAGSGQIVFDMPPTESIEIPDIPGYKHVDYAIGVNGNSMEPVFNDGDVLLVQMTEEIEPGEIGIFIVDGQSYVKKLGNGELISLNKGCDNVELTPDSKCVGRVITSLPPAQQ